MVSKISPSSSFGWGPKTTLVEVFVSFSKILGYYFKQATSLLHAFFISWFLYLTQYNKMEVCFLCASTTACQYSSWNILCCADFLNTAGCL